jgi:hypothetical protein
MRYSIATRGYIMVRIGKTAVNLIHTVSEHRSGEKFRA